MAQLFQQLHIAADADQELIPRIDDRSPKVVAYKARIAAKQRVFWEVLSVEQFDKMTAFVRIGWAKLPTPWQAQAHVPQQRDPHLRSRGSPWRLSVPLPPHSFRFLLAVLGRDPVAVIL